jgi:hypothetical protein
LGVFESGAQKNGALRNNVARIDPADILGEKFLEQNRSEAVQQVWEQQLRQNFAMNKPGTS